MVEAEEVMRQQNPDNCRYRREWGVMRRDAGGEVLTMADNHTGRWQTYPACAEQLRVEHKGLVRPTEL